MDSSHISRLPTKVSIVGCGYVGMAAAYAMLLRLNIGELVLFSRSLERIQGEQLDLQHGLIFLGHSKITATNSYQDLAGSDVIIVTAGAPQKPGQSRLELIDENVKIIKDIIPKVLEVAPGSTIVIVSNPVDILTYHAAKIANLPHGRVFGTGTTLDTSRFRFHLSQMLHVDPSSIHAYILGEHGDSSFPTIYGANVGGQPLLLMDGFSREKAMQAFELARTAASSIIKAKGATCYAIGVVVSHIVECILNDTRSVLPLSVPLNGYIEGAEVAASVPCVLGKGGVKDMLHIALSDEELGWFAKSLQVLKANL